MADDQKQDSIHSETSFRGPGGITEAIILAGGMGTRLQSALPDVPKCLAPVNGRPFLFYVINNLRSQGISRFIFSLGYRHEMIETYLAEHFSPLDYQCYIEKEPLGTGGAIRAACSLVSGDNVLIANGDTLFKISLDVAQKTHFGKKAACTVFLKPMRQFDRYGVVTINDDNRITSFEEKKYYNEGLINGGIYLLNKSAILNKNLPEKFSFEKDYLENLYSTRPFFGSVQPGYFIDIGIPEDYRQVQSDLSNPFPGFDKIDKSWTLFLDRDGVINHEKRGDYIRNWGEFEFYTGARDAIKIFSQKFGKVIVISNQRGIEKGLMTENDLTLIHDHMRSSVELSGGKIDGIYYCTAISDKHPNRKPNPGMFYQALRDYPDINPSKCMIAGNKHSDMLFGRHAGIYTIFIATTNPDFADPHPDADFRYDNLLDFAKAL